MDSASLNVDGVADWASRGLLLLPLLSFLLNGLWLGRRHPKAAAWTATALMGAAAALSLALAAGYAGEVLGHPDRYPGRAAVAWDFTWMDFGSAGAAGSGHPALAGLRAGFACYLDPISVMMAVVVAAISFLVNLYSVGYMAEDKGAGRFFPTLAFFSFSMLGLVLSGNLIQTFFFWELVGAASYLLIGFWYAKPSAVAASKKAFIMTRLADAFFLMGVLLAGLMSGGFDFPHLNGPAAAQALDRPLSLGLFSVNLLALSTMLLYAGAWGKSAMFPLHGWLPDAMEGPTPVSSLIHSATMVVAGVYLTARLYPLFAAAGGTLALVEWTGAFTALFAAVIACAQTDLKRILAFSTLSQLGLMMAALGSGAPAGAAETAASAAAGAAAAGSLAYSASMFHVFTHAFFKCLLFLSAGVVIHAIHSNDIRDAGGLRKALPLTYAATLVAVLALSGIPPFSGFFSKEEILTAAWQGGHPIAFFAALATGGLTAFYMTRYFLLIFHGPGGARGAAGAAAADGGGHGAAGHGHPAPRESLILLLPILILAVPSAALGFFAKGTFLATVLPDPQSASGGAHAGLSGPMGHGGHAAAWIPFAATALALLGVALGWVFYGRAGRSVGYPEGKEPPGYRMIRERFWIDALYLWMARRAAGQGVAAPATWFERIVINGSFDAASWFLKRCAGVVVRLQNGQVQLYMGLALLGLFLIYRLTRGFAG